MFLFLSKLLPVFLYPVGLSCVFLVVSIVLIWKKRSRLALIPITLSLMIIWISSHPGTSDRLMRSLEYQHLPQGDLPKAEAIVVLGGATESWVAPRPWVEVRDEGDRVLYAAKLYRDGKAPKLILSGGRVGWRPSRSSESEEMAQLLDTMGVPRSAMLQDPESLNTRENAENVKKILDAQNIRQVLLVTSAFHMPRSVLIFKKLGMDVIPAPTDFSAIQVNESERSLEGWVLDLLPDAENLRRTTKALKEYIGIFIYALRGWV